VERDDSQGRDLAEILQEAADRGERRLVRVPTQQPARRAAHEVARRWRARVGARWAAAAAAVLVVGTGAVLAGSVLSDDATTPAVPTSTPTDVSSTRPTPTAAPSGDPSTTADAGPILTRPGLPPYRDLTPAVLASAGAGWVAVAYDGQGHDDTDTGTSRWPTTFLLTSPTGDVYLVPGPERTDVVDVVSWRAGSSSLVVSLDDAPRARLDLATGAVANDARGLPTDAAYVGLGDGAVEIWRSPQGWWTVPDGGDAVRGGAPSALAQLDPNGRRSIALADDDPASLVVTDLATGVTSRVAPVELAGSVCTAVAWLDDARVVVVCGRDVDSGGTWTSFVVRLDPGGPQVTSEHPYGADEPVPFDLTHRWDGGLVGTVTDAQAADPCWGGAALFDDDGRMTRLLQGRGDGDSRFLTVLTGRVAYVIASPGCQELAAGTLTAHDLVTGTRTPLVPAPGGLASLVGFGGVRQVVAAS